MTMAAQVTAPYGIAITIPARVTPSYGSHCVGICLIQLPHEGGYDIIPLFDDILLGSYLPPCFLHLHITFAQGFILFRQCQCDRLDLIR